MEEKGYPSNYSECYEWPIIIEAGPGPGMRFNIGGYNITMITGSLNHAGTNSVVNYRLQGTNGDTGTRVFPRQVPAMFDIERYCKHEAHKIPILLYFVKSWEHYFIGYWRV